MSKHHEISRKRPTIYDLAALAGTSPTAVSAVLSGSWKKRRISERLASRIMDLAKEQGYALNFQARALRRERSNIIGMIVPKYDNRYFGAMAERFEALAREHGLFPVITCTQRDPDLELEAARALLSYQVDCLVATGATHPDKISQLCSAAGVRSLNLDLPGTKAASVTSDNYEGARQLTRLIFDRVSSDFKCTGPLLFVGGRASDYNTAARIRGFCDAHDERGIVLPKSNIIASDYEPSQVERALDALQHDLPLGLFVNSTITLEGVVRWLNKTMPDRCGRIRYGCFDYDSFAAQLPDNVGMVEQDVNAMLAQLFQIIGSSSDTTQHYFVPCILRPSNTRASPDFTH